ncbi:MAG: LD-carboxypeptidase [Alistipes sp.]|nr:LD-carboxypeptidase [Alistipes senegalensis]MCM1251076.1 LD-carboxypeptidase [Alistipes sp.]
MKIRITYLLFLFLGCFALPIGPSRSVVAQNPAARTVASPTADSSFVRPPYLQIGDTVGLVAPAGRLPAGTDTVRIREHFASWGLHVKFSPHCYSVEQPYFSASDADRAADLQQMIDDPSVKAVIACRGGYGSVRLMPLLRLEEMRWNPKWLVGFSDITTLHMALAQLGVESIHGPMPGSKFYWEEPASAESLRRALFGLVERFDLPPHPLNIPGKAAGRMAGGNLTVLCSACGTSEEIESAEPTILFIEEVNEHVYRVDRMLVQLSRSGALSNVSAVVVGDFSRMSGSEQFGADAYRTIAAALAPLGIPVVFGFPAGHDRLNLAIYLGRRATVSVDEKGAGLVYED